MPYDWHGDRHQKAALGRILPYEEIFRIFAPG